MLIAAATLVAETFGEDRAKMKLQSQVSGRCGRILNHQVDHSGMSTISNQGVRDRLVGGQRLWARVWGVEEGVASRAVAGLREHHFAG